MFHKWTNNPTRYHNTRHKQNWIKNISIETVTPTSKHDITKEKQKHCTLKFNNEKKLIMIEKNLDNDIIDNDIIDYWRKDLQLIVNDENVFLNPSGWLND